MDELDLDALAATLISTDALDECPLGESLRAALRLPRNRLRQLVPKALSENVRSGLLEREKVGERSFPNLRAAAYRLRAPSGVFAQVISIDRSAKVTHTSVRLLPEETGLQAVALPWLVWDIRMSILAQLALHGFKKAFGAVGPRTTIDFEVTAAYWDTIDDAKRSEMVTRAVRLAADWQLITMGSNDQFELRIRKVVERNEPYVFAYRTAIDPLSLPDL